MITAVWIENQNGDRMDLDLRSSGEELGLLVYNLEGLGSPKATVNSQGGPNFDGVRVSSVSADPRQIILTLAVTKQGVKEEEARALVYQHFPVKQKIRLGIKTDRNELEAECYVEQTEFTQFAEVESATISLYCPQPYFHEVFTQIFSIYPGSGIPLFQFPFSNESLTTSMLEFSEYTEAPMTIIDYVSGVETGVDISMEFSGRVRYITITNTNGNQRQRINLDGIEALLGGNVADGDRVVLNTRIGEKRVWFIRGDTTYNLMNGLTFGDDWITLKPGRNTIVVKASVGEDQINTDIKFQAKREGV